MRPRSVRAGLALVAAALTTSACSASTGSADPAAPAPGGRVPSARDVESLRGWLMTRQAIAEISADATAGRAVAAGPVDEILRPGQQPLPGIRARPVVTFASAIALQAAVRAHALPARSWAVLYDPEAWSFTPAEEQRHPSTATRAAQVTAHTHGLRLIVAPGLDLTTVLSDDAGDAAHRPARFLSLGLAADLARHADVLELQAQSLERDPSAYARFVSTAAAQARRVNPRVQVLAGLSTNPPGAAVTVSELRSDIAATRSAAAGYWLNIPGQGAQCPTCHAADPQIGIALALDP